MAANNSETCAMVGDADLYGIGIRLGFYLQWIITLVVTYNALDYEMLHRTITIILQLGLFSIMLLHTTTRSLRAADAAIGFWLLFGALVSLAADGSAFGVLSGIVRMAFYTLLSGYEAWLWFGGIDALAARRPHTRADGAACDTVVFFGGATAENEAFRGLARTAAIIGVLVFFSLMVKRIYEAREKAAQGREDGPGGPNGWLVLLSVTMIVVSIVAIEHLIRANQMVGLGSLSGVDQLIPFLIGLFGLLDTLLKMSMGQGEIRVPINSINSTNCVYGVEV
ncbi:hypothetical protein F5883DRAFT_655757 [Diaporthe sp. PMI_573]|nr:hypothetical protein F5883DRAFT_655757 [Diaporthaceae sp. PMI_573]